MTLSIHHAVALALLLALAGFFTGPSHRAKPADSYPPSAVTISSIHDVTPAIVRIEFTTPSESVWYCPGVRTMEAADAIYLEFVRAGYRVRASSDPAAKLTVTQMPQETGKNKQPGIIVHHKGKAIFVRSGECAVQVYPLKMESKGH